MAARSSKRGLQGEAAARIGRRSTAPAEDTGDGASSGSTPATAAARGGILGAMAAAAEAPPADGERIRIVELGALAPHPDNIRDGMGDVAGIGASIAERGVLQPLVVVSRAAFEAARPDVDLGAGPEWVILAGHRRHAGAQVACVPTVPVVVRDELAGDDDAVISMLVENLQREDLTPIEQARAFGRLRDRGWSERRISTDTGVSAGQVHKRLSLLRLPEPLVAALGAGELTVADTLRLLELPDDELTDAWRDAQRDTWRGVRGVVEARLAAAQAREHAAQLHTQLGAAGVEVVDDLGAEFGADQWHHRLGDHFTVPGVEVPVVADSPVLPDGAVAHVSTHGGRARVTYYTRDADARDRILGIGDGASAGSTQSTGAAGLNEEDRRRRRDAAAAAERDLAAGEVRAPAGARLVTGQLDPELAAEILADALLVDHTVEPYIVAATAAEWCGADLLDLENELPDDVDDVAVAWMAREAAAGRLAARRAAVAVALAGTENALTHPAQWPYGQQQQWSAHDRRHVRRLAAHAGYELTVEDHQRLATPDTAHDGAAAGGGQGASAGSTPDPEGSPA
ncbi:MAG: ParB/RepB/Spo0J family partition protein [Pseudonocardia sp.]|nr:ParB/RepB/Spo0J family partition protein [Pseudonocardia sp.]